MRDMIQNHLLQLMCIVAMEPPISLDADDVRDEKLKVLRSMRPMDLAGVRRDTVRGQYGPGVADGTSVKGYLQEDQVPPDSLTETFVAMRAHIDNGDLKSSFSLPSNRSRFLGVSPTISPTGSSSACNPKSPFT